jgi:cell cycle sensor histidine kinase DivJ
MRCQPLAHCATEGVEVVAVMRDITARKTQERELEEARNEAVRANVGKSRFLATMTHELRTPLNAIIGFSEMLTKEAALGLDAARRQDYAQLVHASGHHLLAVVNGILDMSKIETGHFEITPEPFAAAAAVSNCCELMSLKARECGIALITSVPADLPNVLADKRALNQILLNLLSNAVKFTNPGGTVTVNVNGEGQWVVFTVEDTGIGISDADLQRVGDPFFQARSSYDRRHDGTGLGVSIVKGLVALHGGRLEVTSRLGQGTRVVVRLPRDCPRVVAAGENPPRKAMRPAVTQAETTTTQQVRKRA